MSSFWATVNSSFTFQYQWISPAFVELSHENLIMVTSWFGVLSGAQVVAESNVSLIPSFPWSFIFQAFHLMGEGLTWAGSLRGYNPLQRGRHGDTGIWLGHLIPHISTFSFKPSVQVQCEMSEMEVCKDVVKQATPMSIAEALLKHYRCWALSALSLGLAYWVIAVFWLSRIFLMGK